MCSAIITGKKFFVVNAVHTVLQDLLLPPGSTKIVSFYNWCFKYSCIKFTWTQKKFTWTQINFAWIRMNLHGNAWIYVNMNKFAWTWVNFAWTHMKVIKISRFAVDIWAMWPVSEIGTLIFVAVFEGPIILLEICEVHLQVSSLHTL